MATARKAPSAPAPKKRTKGDVVPPDFVLRLMDHIGPTAAAKEIGTSPGTLHKSRNAGLISKPLEMAAKGVWQEQFAGAEAIVHEAAQLPRTPDLGAAVASPTSESITTFLVGVPKGREAMLEQAVLMLRGVVVIKQD